MSHPSISVGDTERTELPSGTVILDTSVAFDKDGDASSAPVQIPGTGIFLTQTPSGFAITSGSTSVAMNINPSAGKSTPPSRRSKQRRARRAKRTSAATRDADDSASGTTDAPSASVEKDRTITIVNGKHEEICVVDVKPRSAWTDAETTFHRDYDVPDEPLEVISRVKYVLSEECAGLCLKVTDCNARITRTGDGTLCIFPDRVVRVRFDNVGTIRLNGSPSVPFSGANLCASALKVFVVGGPMEVISLDCSITDAAMAPGGCAAGGTKPTLVARAVALGRMVNITSIGYDVQIDGKFVCHSLAIYADDGYVCIPDEADVYNATIIATRSAKISMENTLFKYSCVARAWDKSVVSLGIANREMLRGSARGGGVINVKDASGPSDAKAYRISIVSP